MNRIFLARIVVAIVLAIPASLPFAGHAAAIRHHFRLMGPGLAWHDCIHPGAQGSDCVRSAGTTNRNTFGHAIEVVARSIADPNGGRNCGLSLIIEGSIKVGYQFINDPGAMCVVSAIVPFKNSYEVDFEGLYPQVLDGFYELR